MDPEDLDPASMSTAPSSTTLQMTERHSSSDTMADAGDIEDSVEAKPLSTAAATRLRWKGTLRYVIRNIVEKHIYGDEDYEEPDSDDDIQQRIQEIEDYKEWVLAAPSPPPTRPLPERGPTSIPPPPNTYCPPNVIVGGPDGLSRTALEHPFLDHEYWATLEEAENRPIEKAVAELYGITVPDRLPENAQPARFLIPERPRRKYDEKYPTYSQVFSTVNNNGYGVLPPLTELFKNLYSAHWKFKNAEAMKLKKKKRKKKKGEDGKSDLLNEDSQIQAQTQSATAAILFGASEDDPLVQLAVSASRVFITSYYKDLSTINSRRELSKYYAPTANIIWNGNILPTPAGMVELYAKMPPTVFEVQCFDAHPVMADGKGSCSIMLLANGWVKVGEDKDAPLRGFCESFILVPAEVPVTATEGSNGRGGNGGGAGKKGHLIQEQTFRFIY